jgi:hypothetical protein
MIQQHGKRAQVRFPWGPLVALYSAITFFMLGIDMALLHLGYRHYHFMAVMPVIFCLVATAISVLTAFSRRLRDKAWVTGALAMIVGLVGTVIHLEIAFANLHGITMAVMLERLIFDPRPPLAPAALAGTGLLMILITWAERWPMPTFERWLVLGAQRFPWIKRMLDMDEHPQGVAAEEMAVR